MQFGSDRQESRCLSIVIELAGAEQRYVRLCNRECQRSQSVLNVRVATTHSKALARPICTKLTISQHTFGGHFLYRDLSKQHEKCRKYGQSFIQALNQSTVFIAHSHSSQFAIGRT
jgi:hypothetical protein